MKILFLEAFFGGSHKDFALGFKGACEHEVTLVTLPDRFWKWRMRGAALYFVNKVKDFSSFDLILTTDMIDVTDLKALASKNMIGKDTAGTDLPPIWIYFHENQLDYPLAPGQKRDYHFGFTNLISALASDRVFFNSKFHLDSFFACGQKIISKMPDARPSWILDQIKKKTAVIYPGCRFEPGYVDIESSITDRPLIIWNHRWEHDKNPDVFFQALSELKKKDIQFSLAVLGQNFAKAPKVFAQAEKEFENELVAFGYLESKQAYLSLLKKGSIVVSCANQENFGISVVEAVRFGCMPLLPKRLSYPEIIPDQFHKDVIYSTDQSFETRLRKLVLNIERYTRVREKLSRHMERYAWKNIIQTYPEI